MNKKSTYRRPSIGPPCPKCRHDMIRTNRTTTDRIINYLSFFQLRCKRFICEQCGTEQVASAQEMADLA